MTISEFKTIGRLLKTVYQELEKQALSEGVDILSDEYKEMVDRARITVLTQNGYTLEEYVEAKKEAALFSKEEQILHEGIKSNEKRIEEVEKRHIPTKEEIAEIAHQIAEDVVKPPTIINKIVKEITVKEPKIIKETIKVKERVEYNDKPLRREFDAILREVKEIKKRTDVDVKSSIETFFHDNFSDHFRKNTDVLGMPDFRKLAMGLQAQIDDLRTNGTSSGGGTWGSITGTLSNQTDLQSALDLKAALISPTFATSITGSYLTASEILITDANKKIVSAPVATYPSLTELSYVKGVTSAIQTQINAKGDALTTNPLSQFASTTSVQLAGVISDETGSGALVFGTSPTFTTQITSPIVYGSAVANGDLVLEGTSHATKTTSIVQIQPTSGAVLIGAIDAVGVVATGLQVTATSGTVFQVTGGNPYNPALYTTAAGNTTMYTFNSQNFSNNSAGNTAITGGKLVMYSGSYVEPYQQALTVNHGYASIGGGTMVLDSNNGGGPDPTASSYKIIQAKFLSSERYYLDGNGKSLQGYDTSNYFTTVISSTGGVTFDAVGSGAGFTFSDSVALGANNLTMTGSLAATGARVTKGWFTDIESTNMPTVGGTSLSSTFQGLDAQLTSLAGLSYTGNAGKFIRVTAGEDGFELAAVAGGGDVSKVGTPVNNQIGVWTGDGTIEGDASLTWDGTSFNIATAKNFQIAGGTVLADAAGTLTLSGIDAIDATTEATIEAAIDTLANLTSIQGRTVTLADAGANAFFGWDDTAGAYENLTASEALAIILTVDGAGSGLDADLLDGKNIGTSGNTVPLLDGTNTWSGTQTISLGSAATTEVLRLVNTTDNASVQVAQFEGDRATMADNDEAYVSLLLSNDGGTQTEFGRLTWVATDVNAATSVDGRLDFAVVTGGSLADELSLDGTKLFPSTSDGLALGDGTNMWADLFLASGGIINFNNGNATITHSAGLLTSNVDIAVPDEAYGAGWNGSTEVPTKNAVYDKIETLGGSEVSTAGVSAGPASSSTQTITHNLGKTPTIIRLSGIGEFESSSNARSYSTSMGVWNSTGNTSVRIAGGAGPNTPVTSTSVSIYLQSLISSIGNATGVVQNVGATTFDIVWTLTGSDISGRTAFMWEAQ